MATPTSFSYAQAAKGQGATTTSSANSTSSPPNGQVSEANEATVVSTTKDTFVATSPASKPEQHEEHAHSAEIGEAAEVNQNTDLTNGSNDGAVQLISAPSASSRRDDDDAATETSNRRSEKGSFRSPSSSTRVTDEADNKKGSRKGRKGKSGDSDKKSKEAEKEKEEPKVELTEAPIPSVNIWAQRKEAQAAKTKPAVTAGTTAVSNTAAPSSTESTANVQEAKKKAKPVETTSTPAATSSNGIKTSRKPDADGDASVKRSGPRGTRSGEKGSQVPSVGDIASWPTPDTVTLEEKQKPAEKLERSDMQEDAAGSKARKKEQWERIDFVPTVNWETHIPAPRGSRGGRTGPGSRPGRDATARSGHGATPTSTTEKTTDAGVIPTKTGNEQREKARDNAPATRANSLPPAPTKQASVDAPRREQRKPATSARSDRPKESGNASTMEHASTRAEGRADRGRGGFHRGRGGHATSNGSHNQQAYMSAGASFPSQQSAGQRPHFSTQPMGQGNSFPGFNPSHSRPGGRGANRGQGSSASYGSRGNNNANRARPLSTTNNMSSYQWDPAYNAMPMTAPPYAPQQPFNFEAKTLLTQQVEYYFSLENLCKDFHLRSQMDSQGFVPLPVIQNFFRVKKICGDNTALLRAACADMTQVDFVAGRDGLERLRSRQYWQNFTLPVEQRHESAKGTGPDFFYFMNNDQQQPTINGMGYGVGGQGAYMNGHVDPSMYMNGDHTLEGNAQLSATVPDFQPGTSEVETANQDSVQPSKSIRSSSASDTPVAETEQHATQPPPWSTALIPSRGLPRLSPRLTGVETPVAVRPQQALAAHRAPLYAKVLFQSLGRDLFWT